MGIIKRCLIILWLLEAITACGSKRGKVAPGINSSGSNGQNIGIDVSHYQGEIKWDEVRKNCPDIAFVYVKCSEGKDYVDKAFKKNAEGAAKNGFRVGAYHFFRMTSGAHEQFEHFRKQIASVSVSLRPMVDVERADGKPRKELQDSLRVLLTLLEKEYGIKPIIYGTNKSYNDFCAPEFNDYPMYIGRYGDNKPVVKGPSHYTVWQYSEKGKIKGIPKDVDLCRFHPDKGIEDILLSLPQKQSGAKHYVEVVQCDSLTVYYPNFTRIDLVTEKMPDKSEKSVIFCCAGSFTGELLSEFKHSNIAGDHVSGGEYFKGYKCGPYNGVFTWSKATGWKFYNHAYKNAVDPLQKAAKEGGMGYCQTLLLAPGQRFKGCFKPEKVNRYRALCQIGSRLCIVDCAKPLPFGHFIDGLEKLGAKYALYCDMGTGWNYSWYRKDDGSIKELFPTSGKYTTNWLTFYKD